MKNFSWKEETGEAIIEATFVYPIVLMVSAFLLLAGLYEMQGVLEYSQAQYVANYAVKSIRNAGYDKFGTIDDKSIDFADTVSDFGTIQKDDIRQKLYHRLLFSKTDCESKMKSKLNSLAGLGKIVNVDTQVNAVCKKSILNTKVVVSVTDSVTMPKFLNYIGLDNYWKRTVTATALVTEPAEFIRNTDLAMHVTDKLLKKLGLSEKIDTVLEKTKQFYIKYIKA